LRFCASLPLRLIWLTHRLLCAPYDRPTEADARLISSIAIMCAR
jgi:hypothetical protein